MILRQRAASEATEVRPRADCLRTRAYERRMRTCYRLCQRYIPLLREHAAAYGQRCYALSVCALLARAAAERLRQCPGKRCAVVLLMSFTICLMLARRPGLLLREPARGILR